jgi:hypothetical protein
MTNPMVAYQKHVEVLVQQQHSAARTAADFIGILDRFFLRKVDVSICKGGFMATAGLAVVNVVSTGLLSFDEECSNDLMLQQ